MKTMPINLIHLFSGIGAFEKALEKMDADFNVVNYCEINKHASLAYSLIHNVPEFKNLGYQCANEGDGVDIGSRCKYHRGTVQHQSVGTIMTSGNDRGVVYRNKETNRLEIRKLTPCECIKLMGFEERDYQILRDSKISESQIYRMAGNSIVVNVVYEILNKLITEGIL